MILREMYVRVKILACNAVFGFEIDVLIHDYRYAAWNTLFLRVNK